MIGIEIIRKQFRYDAKTGILSRNGKEAGWLGQNGYRYVSIKDRSYLVHRVIWAYVQGAWPKQTVDHRDRNSLNNKWENLRDADASLQGRNRGILRSNTSGTKNVYWHKPSNSWLVLLFDHGKQICVGYFRNKNTAIKARENAYHARFGAT